MAKTARVKGNRMLGNGAAPDFLGGFGKPGEGFCVFGKGWLGSVVVDGALAGVASEEIELG